MPKKSIVVEVNPEVLKWLRKSSGWKIEEVSKKSFAKNFTSNYY